MGPISQNTRQKKTLFYFRDMSKIRTFSSEPDYVNYEFHLYCNEVLNIQ